MSYVELEVRLLALPLRTALSAAHDPDPDSERQLTVVKITADGGSVGWGECSALNRVGYTALSAEGAYELLANDPAIVVAGGQSEILKSPLIASAVEMAEFDLRLRSNNVSLATYLGVERVSVPAGAVIPLGSVNASLVAVATAAADGYGRVKLKIAPMAATGFDSTKTVSAVASEFPLLEIHADANGSFDRGTQPELQRVIRAGVTVLEQPYSPSDRDLARELSATEVCVLADEAATDPQTIMDLVSTGACNGVVVKSSRLGGLFETFELLSWCEEEGVSVAAGGMQESGLGRAALAVVAAHKACTLTGDISPARRWLAEDAWEDLEMSHGQILVPQLPGVAGEPDSEVIERLTVKSVQRKIQTP